MAGSCFQPSSLTQASPQGLDQDWSAIAATQCRLDKEGATKLVCDLITSTKNEKIFQESIGLAIRLLDGGNTEIQVCGWSSAPAFTSGGIAAAGLGAGGKRWWIPASESVHLSSCRPALYHPCPVPQVLPFWHLSVCPGLFLAASAPSSSALEPSSSNSHSLIHSFIHSHLHIQH